MKDIVNQKSAFPDLSLERTIEIQRWTVIGDVSFSKKREEMTPFLMRAKERGWTTPEDCAEHLLFDKTSRKWVAKRLLDNMRSLELVSFEDHRYYLTEAGDEALRRGEIFIPHEGEWDIWISEDPLLESPIAMISPSRERDTAYKTVQRRRNKEDASVEIEKTPSFLSKAFNKRTAPLAKGGDFIINRLEENAIRRRDIATIHARWHVQGGKVSLSGMLDDNDVASHFESQKVSPEDVWEQLLEQEGLLADWTSYFSSLLVSFNDLGTGEHESLHRNLTFKSPKIKGLGEFNDLSVRRIPLRPRTREDAQRWSEHRLMTRIQDYATSQKWESWTSEAIAPFSEAFKIRTPSRRQVFENMKSRAGSNRKPSDWYILAAQDWNL